MKKTQFPNRIQNGCLVKSVQTDGDVERITLFNKLIHQGEDLEGLVRSLITKHPYGSRHYWLFIEEPKSKEIVSALALIPWKINFCGEILQAAELGFVGTLPQYRNRGMTRILMSHFHDIVEQERFAFSFLQGIPYFYRQFGYEYAVPLEPHINLKLNRIRGYTEDRLAIRQMTQADLPAVVTLYERCMRRFAVHNERSLPIWRYLLGAAQKTEMIHDNYCVVNKQNRIVAYFRLARHGFGEGLILD